MYRYFAIWSALTSTKPVLTGKCEYRNENFQPLLLFRNGRKWKSGRKRPSQADYRPATKSWYYWFLIGRYLCWVKAEKYRRLRQVRQCARASVSQFDSNMKPWSWQYLTSCQDPDSSKEEVCSSLIIFTREGPLVGNQEAAQILVYDMSSGVTEPILGKKNLPKIGCE